MPGAIPACFRGAPAAPSGSGAGPSLATSVYETRLGLVALSWTRSKLGLCLRAVLRLSPPPSPTSAAGYDDDPDEETLEFCVRPWLFWRRRGSKRFHVGDRRVRLVWDLTRARFAGSGSPEPLSGFFVAVVVDGEMALPAGDRVDEAYRRSSAKSPPGPHPVLLSRREQVSMRDAGHGRSHKTWVTVRGKEREISIDLVSRVHGKERVSGRGRDKAEVGMSVAVDGEQVIHVRRLRWKFRGSERVDLGAGDCLQVSWDLHKWLFPSREPLAADAAVPAHAVFVFRIDLAGGGGVEPELEKELCEKASGRSVGVWRGYLGRWGRGDWSESGSNGGSRRKGKGRRLAMASSSSSASVASSTASWASGSTVMDWASPEEAEMQRGDGFSLVVYAWKS